MESDEDVEKRSTIEDADDKKQAIGEGGAI